MSAVLAASTAPQRVEQTPGKRALRRLLRRRTAVFGLIVVVLMALLAIFAPWVAPFDPLATSFAMVRKAPSAAHWFGTDEVGRDLLARVIYGGARLARRRRDRGVDRGRLRRAARHARRLRRRADRCGRSAASPMRCWRSRS